MLPLFVFAPLLFAGGKSGAVDLNVDARRVAVLAPGSSALDLEVALEALGTHAVRAWPIPGWWLVEIEHAELEAGRTPVDVLARGECVPFASPVFVGRDGGPVWATPDLLVGFERATSVETMERVLGSLIDFEIVERRFGGMEHAFRLRTCARDARLVIDAARCLAQRADVLFADPDMIFTGRGGSIPNDPLFPACWALHNVGQSGGTPDVDLDAPEAWDRVSGVPSIVIAILDVGVELAHPDLALAMLPGADVTSDGPGTGNVVNAFDNHGTAVAGCAVATRDNALGIAGVAPGCRAVSVRAFITVLADGTWTTAVSWTINALNFAQSIGARVTNNSNIYGFTSPSIDQKYVDTWNAGLVHFACAGNSAVGSVVYPASIPIVNSVGAIQSSGNLSAISNFGPGLDFVAPGQAILATDRVGTAGWDVVGDYVSVSGTSFAAPFAAGVAALVLSADPSLSAAQVEQVLQLSATDSGAPGYDTVFGHGRVNALNALQVACGTPTNYCQTSPNSVGPGATITFAGSQSLATNDLVLIAGGAPTNAFGRFYFGTTAAFSVFGNGFRCVGGSTIRFPIIQSNVFGDFIQSVDVNNLPQPQVFVPGTTRFFQLWYRNAAAGGAGFNLSDGLQVRFCP